MPAGKSQRSGATDSELPMVSVIVPSYNRAALLPRALKSIFGQQYPRMEVIVVDDGSTDDTQVLVERCAETQPELMYVNTRGPVGPGAARNVGASMASGEVLTFLDSDDQWMDATLLPRVDRLWKTASSGVVGVVARRVHCAADGSVKSITKLPRVLPDSLGGFLRKAEGAAWPTLVVMKSAFLAVGGFDKRLHSSEWWDLCARLSGQGRLLTADLEVERHYDHDAPRQWTLERRIEAARVLAAKYAGEGRIGRRYASERLCYAGRGAVRLGRDREARLDYRSALSHRFSPRALVGVAATLDGPLGGVFRKFYGLPGLSRRRSAKSMRSKEETPR